MALNEMGINLVPQYCDFNVVFRNITKDGSALNFNTVANWVFVLASSVQDSPVIYKTCNASGTSGPHVSSFIVDTTNRTVTVSVEPSGSNSLNNGFGTYFTALYAETSGKFLGHLQKYLTIQPGIRRSSIAGGGGS